jgi:hypothetical protein
VGGAAGYHCAISISENADHTTKPNGIGNRCAMKVGFLVQWSHSVSRSLLPTNLPLLSRRLQLPIPLGVDRLPTPGEHVLRRDARPADKCE